MAFKELFGSRRIQKTVNGLTGERIFLGDTWLQAIAAAPKIGDPFPGIIGLACTSVEFLPEGKTVPDPNEAASHARVIARYATSTQTEKQQTGRKISQNLEFGGEMLTKAGGKWKDCGAEVKKEDIGGTWYPRLEYTLETTVPNNQFEAEIKKIYKATGKVNSTVFLGGQAESWLFEGVNASDFYDEEGNQLWTLIYRFIYRDTSWNKVWHIDHDGGPKWEEVVFKPEGGDEFTLKLYESTDFNTLVGFPNP